MASLKSRDANATHPLRWRGTALLGALVILALLTGCAVQAARLARLEAGQPAVDGTLTLGTTLQPTTLNPLLATDAASRAIVGTMFDGLFAVNDRLEMVPELAEGYDVSPDGLIWTFRLRKSVRFHDGEELTAEDVKFTYDTIMRDKNARVAKADYANVKAIEAADKYAVRFTFSEKSAAFPSKLYVGIVPKHLLAEQDLSTAEFNRRPVGSGPFAFEEWLPSQKVSIRANEDYFKGRPKLERIVWKLLPDGNAQNAQFVSGEIDGGSPELQLVDQLRQAGRFAVYDWPGGISYIGLQNENPLFQDKRVRQAMNYGLDKQAIVAKIMSGTVSLATSSLTPNSWAFNPNVSSYPYDKEKAKKLLADAGWKPGADGLLTKGGQRFKFSLLTNKGSKQRDLVALFARQQWSQLGMEVDVQFMELNAFINERVLKSSFEAVFLSGALGIDPELLSRSYHSKSMPTGHNFLHYSNSEVDKLLTEGRVNLDQTARKQIYFKVQEIIGDDSPQIPLYYQKSYIAIKSSLEGLRPNPWNLFWNVEEWQYPLAR
ncbi:MAG: hypothetical protein HYX94_11200 [Chloroflexi bacterium]|nr:hypothetical protein [Chloroflexota bacterium]